MKEDLEDLMMKLAMATVTISFLALLAIVASAIVWIILAMFGVVEYPWNVPVPRNFQ